MSLYLKQVPCIHCGNWVIRRDREQVVQYRRGKITVFNLPEYKCKCGLVFAPQDIEAKLHQLVQCIEQRKLKGNLKIDFEDFAERGAKAIPYK